MKYGARNSVSAKVKSIKKGDVMSLVWFDVNKERDWRINSSPPTLEAFARAAQDPYFNP